VLGTAAASLDREVDAVAAGVKPACLKEGIPGDESEGLVRAYVAMGLFAEVVSRHDLDEGSGRHRDGGSRAIVAVAREEATLRRLVESQRTMEAAHDRSRVAEVGRLMGFPPCCVAAFEARADRGDNLDLERAPFRTRPDEPLHPR